MRFFAINLKNQHSNNSEFSFLEVDLRPAVIGEWVWEIPFYYSGGFKGWVWRVGERETKGRGYKSFLFCFLRNFYI